MPWAIIEGSGVGLALCCQSCSTYLVAARPRSNAGRIFLIIPGGGPTSPAVLARLDRPRALFLDFACTHISEVALPLVPFILGPLYNAAGPITP
jgi:hypothetical protein